MTEAATRYDDIRAQIGCTMEQHPLAAKAPCLIAVSKRQPEARIDALLALGHREFGENQLQEAQARWADRREIYPDLTLHLIGPLQSNKVKPAVALFDVIHTVDREKIARAIKKECEATSKHIPCFVQVNIGEEPQKAGVTPNELPDFLSLCHDNIGLDVIGLMAIPPAEKNAAPYFALMKKLAERHDLPNVSMGMSGDWQAALRFGATHIRLGTALFGERDA